MSVVTLMFCALVIAPLVLLVIDLVAPRHGEQPAQLPAPPAGAGSRR